MRDVADVRVGTALKRGDGSRNGRPAVILGIHRQPDANTLALTRDLDRVLDDVQADLPPGMLDTRLFRHAPAFVERSAPSAQAARAGRCRRGSRPGLC